MSGAVEYQNNCCQSKYFFEIIIFKMEKVIEMFDRVNLKVKNIEEKMIVIPHKPKLMTVLSKMSKTTSEVKNIEAKIKASIEDHNKSLTNQYETTTRTIKRCQLKMLLLQQYLQDQEKDEQKQKRALREIGIPGTPKLYERAGATQAFSELNTPRMLVTDYAKSPFTKMRTKVQLQFSDFEAEVSKEDFAKVPAYMRGRSTLSELQEFLDNVVIRTFNNKYRTLFQHRSSLKPSEFTLQSMFKSQASYFEGQKFITVGDIARIIEKNVDKKDDRFIQMLRHLQIIREARKNSICCYIWLR